MILKQVVNTSIHSVLGKGVKGHHGEAEQRDRTVSGGHSVPL